MGEFHIIDAETESLTIKFTLSHGRSLTYHFHKRRGETWMVIEGRGWVKLDGNEFAVVEGKMYAFRAACFIGYVPRCC